MMPGMSLYQHFLCLYQYLSSSPVLVTCAGLNLTYHGATFSGVSRPYFSREIQNSEPISHFRLVALCH